MKKNDVTNASTAVVEDGVVIGVSDQQKNQSMPDHSSVSGRRVRKKVKITVATANAEEVSMPTDSKDLDVLSNKSLYVPEEKKLPEETHDTIGVQTIFSNHNRDRVNSQRTNALNNVRNTNKSGGYRRQQNRNNSHKVNKSDVSLNPPSPDPSAPRISINDLTNLSVPLLREKAESLGLTHDVLLSLKKQEIIMQILKAHTNAGGVIFAYGSLETLQDGYGFLRSPQNSYLAGNDDIYIAPNQIRAFNLKTGDTVYGQIRAPKDGERFFAMQRVETVNLDTIEVSQNRVPFENLTPIFPNMRLNMEVEAGDVSTRVINLFCPIGKGQRGLIVAPPRTGKTVLMQKIANAITENHPECYLIVLLIDERPEEVTDMKHSVKGEVIASTFDEQASRHVQVAEMVLEKSKRMVEQGHDVVILLDSITRLARAYNQTIPTSGKILSGGVDSNALHRPKRFFGAARNIEGGGSLTIVATALIDTGSKMDTVIFEEFKGTGNMEVTLDRRLSDKRVFPAINIKSSGTRKEEMLLTTEEVNKVWVLRKALSSMEDIQMTELILEKMRKFKTNDSFLRSMSDNSDNAGRS